MFVENILKYQSKFLRSTRIILNSVHSLETPECWCIESHIWSDPDFCGGFSCFFHVFQNFNGFPSRIFLGDPHSALKKPAKDHNLVPGLLILTSHERQAFRHQISVSMPCACIHLSLPFSSATFCLLSFLRRTRLLLLPS